MASAAVASGCVTVREWEVSMSQRAAALADRFHQAREEFIRTIDGCTTDQLQTQCHGEQCSIAALASHVAGVHALGADLVRTAAAGEPLPTLTIDDINAMNAEQFTRDANRPKEDILRDLRTHGDAAEQVVRQLSDAELDQTGYLPLLGRELTTAQIIESVVIGDVEGHLGSITEATQPRA